MDTELKRIMAPSLSLLTLAGMTPDEHTVTITDENIESLDMTDLPNLVGLSVTVDTAHRAYQIADTYRRKGVLTVLGGIHASACPEEAADHCHSVCIGNAEPVWTTIIADAENGTLKPRYQAAGSTDPKTIPMPSWETIDRTHYLYSNVLAASRGCPFRCNFCYNSCDYRSERYLPRPVPHVIQEIKRLNTRHIMFVDDNLIGDIGWTRDLLNAMRPLHLKWNAAVSANLVYHEDLLDLMAASGCHSLFIGFESITDNGLQKVNKQQNRAATYEKLVEMIHSRGIMINASLVFGLDDHTPDVFPTTLEWLINHKIETMTAHIMTPYPGTKLYQQLLAEGRITDFDWSHYNTSEVVFQPKHMTADELRNGYLWMYTSLYSFGNIWKRLPNSKKQRIPYLLFNLGYRKFGRFTSALSKLTSMSAIGRMGRKWAYGLE